MVDTKTIETFLKEANGSIQPAHKTILEDFLRLKRERITTDKIKIEIEDLETLRRQYGLIANHEIQIQAYRIEQMQEKMGLDLRLQRECEKIISLYTKPVVYSPTTETLAASLEHIGGL